MKLENGNFEKRFYLIVIIIFYPLWIFLYQTTGYIGSKLNPPDLAIWIDHAIPLVKWFVYPYEICYIMPFLALFFIRDKHQFNRLFIGMLLVNAIAFFCFVVYPVTFKKPVIVGSDFTSYLLRVEYAIEYVPTVNNSPSLHVAIAMIIALCSFKRNRVIYGVVSMFLALLIAVSTLFIKQHIFIDVVSGILVAVISYFISGYMYERFSKGIEDPIDAFKFIFKKLRLYIISYVLLLQLLMLRVLK